MTNLFLKPARDAAGAPMLVRDPVTMKPLAEAGEWKTRSPFWIRRLRDKDVTEATPSSPPAIAAPTPPAPAIEPAVDPIEPAAGTSLLNLIKPA